MWEQFAIVATDLLERIQSSITYFNNLSDTSDEEEPINGKIKNGWQGNFKNWLEE